MSLLNTAGKVYFGNAEAEAVYMGTNLVWTSTVEEPTDPPIDDPYGNGVYGEPLSFTTAGTPGPFVITDARTRLAVTLSELGMDTSTNKGYPYRIDFDVTASNGGVLNVDWCDLAPMFSQAVVAGEHYGHESIGRTGGYTSTYRFVDFQCNVGGSVTVNNIMIRRIYEFSS